MVHSRRGPTFHLTDATTTDFGGGGGKDGDDRGDRSTRTMKRAYMVVISCESGRDSIAELCRCSDTVHTSARFSNNQDPHTYPRRRRSSRLHPSCAER